jgi:endonuclease III
VMPVDGGILRVSRRLGLIAPRGSADEAQRVLEGGVEPREVYSLHLSLIRFGRELCTPAAPACPVCPLNDLCAHFRGDLAPPRAYTARPNQKGNQKGGQTWQSGCVSP